MKRFVEGEDRRQGVLLPEFLDDYVSEENPVRVIDVFVEELDLGALGFEGGPEATERPAYHPGVLLVATSRASWVTQWRGPSWRPFSGAGRASGPTPPRWRGGGKA